MSDSAEGRLTISHDEFVTRVIAACAQLDERLVLDGMVLGAIGRWPRGRQTAISYAKTRHLEPHAFHNPDLHLNPRYVCEICGMQTQDAQDPADVLEGLYKGNASNEFPGMVLFDLEERLSLETPALEEADHIAFKRLLDAIDAGPAEETPRKLTQRLTKAGLFKRKDKYVLDGILQGFAEVGLMPNDHVPPSWDRLVPTAERWAAGAKVPGSRRSDIVLPLAGWRGHNGINWAQARACFAWL